MASAARPCGWGPEPPTSEHPPNNAAIEQAPTHRPRELGLVPPAPPTTFTESRRDSGFPRDDLGLWWGGASCQGRGGGHGGASRLPGTFLSLGQAPGGGHSATPPDFRAGGRVSEALPRYQGVSGADLRWLKAGAHLPGGCPVQQLGAWALGSKSPRPESGCPAGNAKIRVAPDSGQLGSGRGETRQLSVCRDAAGPPDLPATIPHPALPGIVLGTVSSSLGQECGHPGGCQGRDSCASGSWGHRRRKGHLREPLPTKIREGLLAPGLVLRVRQDLSQRGVATWGRGPFRWKPHRSPPGGARALRRDPMAPHAAAPCGNPASPHVFTKGLESAVAGAPE